MSMFTKLIEVETQGSAGAASGSSRIGVGGACRLVAVRLDYSGSAPATTDVTIVTDRAMDRTLFTRTNSAADGMFYPRVNAHKTDTTAIPAGDNPYEQQVVSGMVEVRVAQCDALATALTATLFFEA